AEERISDLFVFDVSLIGTSPSLDLDSLLGESITITLDRAAGEARYFNGIVGRISQGGAREGNHSYRAEVYPALWLLTHSAENRIRQMMTVPEILQAVLAEHGISDVRDELTGTYPIREYC